MTPRHVAIGNITIGNNLPMVFIVGPNTLESRAHVLEMSAALAEIARRLGIDLIYKTSFEKANRTSIAGERGIGLTAGLPILAEVRETTGLPILTDIHAPEQCAPVAEAVDVLQIPAFLHRQTDLLLAAGETRAAINIKKGQFAAPWDMANAAGKVASTGNERIMLCERGAMFGYNTLVVDTTGLDDRSWASKEGYPHSIDAHVQERFARMDHNDLKLSVTMDDPKIYTKPFFLGDVYYRWVPNQQIDEKLCVPSEAVEYMESMGSPAGSDPVAGSRQNR